MHIGLLWSVYVATINKIEQIDAVPQPVTAAA